jgi:hypothetical protein
MPYFLSPIGNNQQCDANGNPLVGGKIYTYLAGSSTTSPTYTDITSGTQQANPIILNSLGLPTSPIWMAANVPLKFVIKDFADVLIRTIDNISGVNDITSSSAFQEWISSGLTPTYISATSFSFTGDQTGVFQPKRRLLTSNTGGTIYATILTSVFSAGITTITVVTDSGVLDSGLSAVSYGILSATNSSVPIVFAKLGANSDITSLSAVTSINGGQIAGLRNRFINGGLAIDQRNSGAAQTFTAGAALAYCIDRWYGYCTGANVTGQRVAGSGNTQYRYQFTGAASVTKIGFAQRIEQANSYDLNNRSVVVGVELANSLLTTVTWNAWYANTADTFGTLASPTRTLIGTGTITVTSTSTRYYVPITFPAAATTGIEIEFSVGAQTSGTFTIGEAQIVPGSANELWREHRTYGLELALCQRYYEKSYQDGTVPGTAITTGAFMGPGFIASSIHRFFVPYKVNKRVAATVRYWDVVGTLTRQSTFSISAGAQTDGVNGFGFFSGNEGGIQASFVSGATPVSVQFHWDATAEL